MYDEEETLNDSDSEFSPHDESDLGDDHFFDDTLDEPADESTGFRFDEEESKEEENY